MNVDDILRGELIGLNVEIVKADNDVLVGINGKIVDETRNMLKIGDKMVVKEQVVLKIEKDGNFIEVDGKLLVGRPEDRVKKVRRL